MTKKFLIVAFLSIFKATLAVAAPLKVMQGKKSSSVAEVDLNKLKEHSVSVTDPNESTAKQAAVLKFKGLDGREVLDLAFGGRRTWEKSRRLTFECSDGYKPSIETKDLLKGGFFFATAKDGSKDFSIINNLKDGKKADLAPFYIVWTDRSMQTKEKSHNWPYQVVGIILD